MLPDHNPQQSPFKCVAHTWTVTGPGLPAAMHTDRIFTAWKTNTFDALLLTYLGISEVVVYDFKKVFVDSLAMKENSASKSWSVNFVWKNWATHARDSVSYKTMLFIEKHLMRRLRITNRPKLISRIWSEYLNLGHRRNYEVKNSYITTKTLIAYFEVSISSRDLHQKKLVLSSSESWSDDQLSHQEGGRRRDSTDNYPRLD